MKNTIITASKLILSDRLMTVLLGVFILGCIAYCIYVVSALRPSDLQVAVHYSAFGMTNFYREKWYYLLSFALFGGVLMFAHVVLAARIYSQERRQLALLFTALSILMLFVAWVLTRSVLRIAAF